jgi:hypothetical protein
MHVLVEEKYDDDDQCYFAICESCYWTATIFSSYMQHYPGGCPLCKKDQLALIPLCKNEKLPHPGLETEFMIEPLVRNLNM